MATLLKEQLNFKNGRAAGELRAHLTEHPRITSGEAEAQSGWVTCSCHGCAADQHCFRPALVLFGVLSCLI